MTPRNRDMGKLDGWTSAMLTSCVSQGHPWAWMALRESSVKSALIHHTHSPGMEDGEQGDKGGKQETPRGHPVRWEVVWPRLVAVKVVRGGFVQEIFGCPRVLEPATLLWKGD